jgi:hypothetical protein
METPGEWRFDIYAGDIRDAELSLVDQMYVTIREAGELY